MDIQEVAKGPQASGTHVNDIQCQACKVKSSFWPRRSPNTLCEGGNCRGLHTQQPGRSRVGTTPEVVPGHWQRNHRCVRRKHCYEILNSRMNDRGTHKNRPRPCGELWPRPLLESAIAEY